MVFNQEKLCQMLLIGVDTHILNPKSSLILEPPHQHSLALLLLLN